MNMNLIKFYYIGCFTYHMSGALSLFSSLFEKRLVSVQIASCKNCKSGKKRFFYIKKKYSLIGSLGLDKM